MPLQSDVFEAQTTPASNRAPVTLDAAKIQGRIRSTLAVWTADGSEGGVFSISMVRLPADAYVIDVEVNVIGTGEIANADVGDADNLSRYVGDAPLNVKGLGGIRQPGGAGYKIANEAQRTILLSASASNTTGYIVAVNVRWAQT